MSPTLEEIRLAYPTANYAPDPGCKKCGGKGEWWDKRSGHFFKPGWRACICIFVEHSSAPEAARMLRDVARDELKKLLAGQPTEGGSEP